MSSYPKLAPRPTARQRKQAESEILAKVIEQECRPRDIKNSNRCLACLAGFPGGTLVGTEYNHCIPRSLLPGRKNWPILHSAKNLVLACHNHHAQFDRLPDFWLPLMERFFKYSYTEPVFRRWLQEK